MEKEKQSEKQTELMMGWSDNSEDKDVNSQDCAMCVDTSFHVVTSEDEFQELLKGLFED
ncbi:hypothetical protein [Atopobacter phocae]|uniref:hypothetical protein n=1 Tax=Atopobacter phocae TaxID=136492 RepID=UPI0004B405CB|nr:hypothetical protein [Atopobacter phocae]